MYVPSDLDAALIPLVATRAPRFLDHYRWIIHSIVYRKLTDHRYEDPSSFIPINQEVLRRTISQRKAKDFLIDLHQWEFIESIGYEAGVRSRGFRIKPPYDRGTIIGIEITDARLAKKVRKHVQNKHDAIRARNDGYSAVLLWLEALNIDEVSASEHTRTHFKEDDWDSRNSRLVSIDAIAKKQFRIDIDGSGRAHHNLSNLAGDLRPFVSIDGRPLYQVDVACSQPRFMHFVLRDEIADKVEVARMEDLLTTGFYAELNTKGIPIEPFKERFFADVLFGRGDYTNWVTEAFEAQFPSYANAIAKAKEENYKQFAIALQQAEARVIFDAVKRFVAATGGKAPVLTIHDSLVTWPECTRTARDALEAAFHDQYGAEPLLRVKAPTTEIKSNKNSKRLTSSNMNKKEKLTCVEIKVIGTIKTAHGTLIRFYVRFSNGESGEYWGKTDASAKNFPLNIPHWYKSEILTKRDGKNTRKYQPCKKDEIPLTEHGEEALGDAPIEQAHDLHEPAATVQRPFAKGEPNFRTGGATAEDIAALKGTLHLVSHGKIGMDDIEPTALKLKEIIVKLSNQ